MKVRRANVDLIRIEGYVAHMPPERYIQEASRGPGNRYYVTRGAAGGLSISSKRVTVLACCIIYLNDDHYGI